MTKNIEHFFICLSFFSIVVKTYDIKLSILRICKCPALHIMHTHIDVQPPLPSIHRDFSSPQAETLFLLNGGSPLPSPQPLTVTILLSVSLTPLATSYKQTSTVFVLLWLASFS